MSVPTEPVIESDVALPVGLHLQAPAFDEVTLFRAASAVERLGSTSD